MATYFDNNSSDQQWQSIQDAIESGSLKQVARTINKSLTPSDLAHLLESSPPRQRKIIWQLIEADYRGDVLQYLNEDVQAYFLSQLNAQEVIDATEDLDTDDLADILQNLPETITSEVLDSMDAQDRERVEEVLAYEEDTAGGLMNTDTVTIRADITLDVVLRYLRRHRSLPEMTDSLLVVSRKGVLVGTLPLTSMLVSNPSATVREVMATDTVSINVSTSSSEVATLFARQDLVTAPVVNDEGILLGRITIDDVVDVIREDADHSLLSMAGLDEDSDTFAPVKQTAKRRAVWLGINLVTAFIASGVIGMFEATIEQVVALAVLMPIVASMGGIAGSQTLTLVIRGMAVGQISSSNLKWLLNREFVVSLLNGMLWAIVVSGLAVLWFSDPKIGVVIAAALLINLVVAALAGTALPYFLKSRNIDPALAGGVILTTITDVVGFLSFLGLASIAYG
ncbi:magnesium transporter [Oleiphilus sp. HI0071]|jgi:magnesium transporter|nr:MULTISPECIES: magnesium transporter [unclassified Oleiphilus]KZY59179.1 magnesium transporter [Oleiphilus sp. HI0065]KZY80087.1 magnesium transporter [Oleiphilus sp. HI0071]KZY96649.1 magnesium transporter [Oleiphilus sp. HI0073]KZZ40864.1 magnesium transporter [Oleiphilus sp. HI0118]KZZ50841.1 magnesium transporter [Oleiphilus sp. HI0122]KZZ65815.1 magnesium transporter [Oleiphilus sp. HI0130]KZZ74173.1 magnesium transporter [Oleiphilus sp. HI0133]